MNINNIDTEFMDKELTYRYRIIIIKNSWVLSYIISYLWEFHAFIVRNVW